MLKAVVIRLYKEAMLGTTRRRNKSQQAWRGGLTMLGGIIATTIRMVPIVTLLMGLGILIGVVSLVVYGAFASRREANKAIGMAAQDIKQTS